MAGLLAVVLAENLLLGASAFELLSSRRASLLLMRGRKNWSCGRPGTVLLEKWLILPFSTTLKKNVFGQSNGKSGVLRFFLLRRIGKNMG